MSNIKYIYQNIQEDNIQINEPTEFLELPSDLSKYLIAYIGKHKAIFPGQNISLEKDDFLPYLLIECRLFNENEEIMIYPQNGKIYQRIIKSGNEKYKYISKTIELRNPVKSDKRLEMEVRHYIDETKGGYSFLRYYKLEQ